MERVAISRRIFQKWNVTFFLFTRGKDFRDGERETSLFLRPFGVTHGDPEKGS
jgi:hypothetical protein